MGQRREDARHGWVIMLDGHLWDDWVYPTEVAARATADQCHVKDAEIIHGKLQGYAHQGRQSGARMLADRKWRRR